MDKISPEIIEYLRIKTQDRERKENSQLKKIDRPEGYQIEDGIRSKTRVIELAEVFTPEYLVQEMLDCIPSTEWKLESRILEPSCGNGNFLVEAMAKKLQLVSKKNTQEEMLFDTLVAVSTIYGIDISQLNIEEARIRLREMIIKFTKKEITKKINEFENVIDYILEKNIIFADFLLDAEKIQFYEFTFPKKYFVSQRIFTLLELYEINSDELVFPRPSRIIPTVHYLDLK